MHTHLEGIHIPKNVKEIGDAAFQAVNYEAHENYALQGGRVQSEMRSLKYITFAEDSKLESTGEYAFAYNDKLESIVLPDSLKTMGPYSFTCCFILKDVTMPAALENLGYSSFYCCYALSDVTFQEGIKEIGGGMFSVTNTDYGNFMYNLEEFVIPASVVTIGQGAFENLPNLRKVTIAEGSKLEMMYTSVFKDCTSLEGFTFPASFKTFATSNATLTINGQRANLPTSYVFRNCPSLKYVDFSACTELLVLPTRVIYESPNIETLRLPPNLQTLYPSALGGGTFTSGGSLGVPITITKKLGPAAVKELVIPASVTTIGAFAFAGMSSLETLIFEEGSPITVLGSVETTGPESAEGIGMFAGATALKTVVLPKGVTQIGHNTFEGAGFENVELPSTVRYIGNAAFKDCVNLTKVNLSAELLTLGDQAFYGCAKLEQADMYFGLEYIGSQAFAYCASLKNVYNPATVEVMPGNPFQGCTGVESFSLDEENVDFVMVDGVLYDKVMYTLIYYPASLTADTFDIPDNVFEIGIGAFSGAQVKTLVLPEQITAIPAYAFDHSSLETITLSRQVTSIGEHAFEGCANLNNVVVPNTATQIGSFAFAGCTSLSNIRFEDVGENETPYTLGTNLFDGCTALTEMVLPNRVTNDTLPAYMYANTGIIHAVIPDLFDYLYHDGVFYNCKQLETVTFENKALSESLGKRYFYGCSKLKEIVIGAGEFGRSGILDGSEIFAECTALEKVTVYSSMIGMGAGAGVFRNCINLRSIEILAPSYEYDEFGNIIGYGQTTPNGFLIFEEGAFEGCINLKSIPIRQDFEAVIYGSPFTGSGIEELKFSNIGSILDTGFMGYPYRTFAGSNIKTIYFGKLSEWVNFVDEIFAGVDHEMNIYFYHHTYEEVVELCNGKMGWYETASENVHIYFKDTMPSDVVVPGGTDIPTGG